MIVSIMKPVIIIVMYSIWRGKVIDRLVVREKGDLIGMYLEIWPLVGI